MAGRTLPLGLCAAFLLVATSRAEARDIFLNGVKLDASVVLKPTSLSGCDVRFDEKGDIFILAKGYNITAAPAPGPQLPPPAPPPPPPPAQPPLAPPPPAKPGPPTVDTAKKGVWLVSRQTQRGIVQYDVDVYVNGGIVKRIRSVEDPTVLEITKSIKPGENRIRMVATKNIPEKRVSMSPTDTLDVLVGEGTVGGATVNIERVLMTFTRTAAETGSVSEEFSLYRR